VISKGSLDKVKLEVSINSVRVSLAVQMKDDVEKMIGRKFMAFMMRRADSFKVLRKVPVEVTNQAMNVTVGHVSSRNNTGCGPFLHVAAYFIAPPQINAHRSRACVFATALTHYQALEDASPPAPPSIASELTSYAGGRGTISVCSSQTFTWRS